MGKYHSKGKFHPQNPQKYRGDPDNITYRSSWEKKMMIYCDQSPNVVEWGSEEVVVPYVSPVDGKWHRYFVDFILKNAKGQVLLIEVKPENQTTPPKTPQRKSKKHLKEVATWGVNRAKWDAAIRYAEDRGWKFKILTEKNARF